MRKIVYIVCLLFTSYNLYAQEWRDSLNAARDAYKVKDYSNALKYYQSAQKKAPKGIDFSKEIAQAAYKASDYKKAEQIFKKTSSKKGSKAEKFKNFHNLGNSRMKQKNYQGAIDAYKEAIRNHPNDEQTRYNLSEAIRKLKQSKDNKDKKKNDPKNNQQPPKKNDKKNQPQIPPNGKKKNDKKEEQTSKLPNKMIDRILDKLMKEEEQTKSKISGKKEEKCSVNSGKDW